MRAAAFKKLPILRKSELFSRKWKELGDSAKSEMCRTILDVNINGRSLFHYLRSFFVCSCLVLLVKFYLLQDMLVLVEGMKFCVAMTKTKVRVIDPECGMEADLLNSNRHQVIPRKVSWIRIPTKLFRERSPEFELPPSYSAKGLLISNRYQSNSAKGLLN